MEQASQFDPESLPAFSPKLFLLARAESHLTNSIQHCYERSRWTIIRLAQASVTATAPNEGDVAFAELNAPIEAEDVFRLASLWRLDRPVPAILHLHLTSSFLNASDSHLLKFLSNLRSGSPFQRVVLHASDKSEAARVSTLFGCCVHYLPPDLDELGILRRITGQLDEGASLIIQTFGPVVVIISALWGRTGSTAIFDAQMAYFQSRGCFVVRLMIDHWPQREPQQTERVSRMLFENFSDSGPHCASVILRNTSKMTPDGNSSAVARFNEAFVDSLPTDPGLVAWLQTRAGLVVVNHLFHTAWAQQHFSCPLILETHDVLSEQLDTHGIPPFAQSLVDTPAHRAREQEEIWGSVAACVNLSDADQSRIAPHAKVSAVARPYFPPKPKHLRPWYEVSEINGLTCTQRIHDNFDLVLWGDWHNGNIRGVTWFFDEVVPLSKAIESAEIAIVGRISTVLPPDIMERQNVHGFGFVDQLDDFLGRSRVLVIPDLGGSGASIKMLETLALGLPFAATSAGMRAVQQGGMRIPGAANAQALADDIELLLSSSAERKKRAAAADALFTLNASQKNYEATWDHLLQEAAPVFFDLLTKQSPSDAQAHATSRRGEDSYADNDLCLSAIICTYNRYDVLPGAIASLLRQNIPDGRLEIIVVDNSPDHDQARAYGARYADEPSIRYLIETTPGLSNARNVGAQHALGKVVAYIDDDAVAAPDWAQTVVNAFSADLRVGAVGGRVVARWLSERPHWLEDSSLTYLSVIDWGGDTRLVGDREWIVGCNIAFDRELLFEVGGFNTQLGRIGAGHSLLSNEENAVLARIKKADRIVLYEPRAAVEHLIEPSRLTPEWFRKRMAWQAVSDFIENPVNASQEGARASERLARYLQDRHSAHPPGFYSGSSGDPPMSQMYDVVTAALTGGVSINSAPSPMPQKKRKKTLQERWAQMTRKRKKASR